VSAQHPATPSAIVTGGSRGIGRAIAHVLAESGFAVTVCGRDTEALDGVVAELQALAPAQGIVEDLGDAGAPARIVERHRDAFGSLNALVNNAGFGSAKAITETSDRRLAHQVELNFATPVRFYRERGHGGDVADRRGRS